MNVCHTLICCFLLTALQDGNTGRVSAKTHTGQEGGDITVRCDFTFSGKRRLFCKGRCEEGNILIDTREDTAQSGRYSVRYKKNSVLSSDFLYVSITKLQKSDSGQYRCGLERTFSPDSYHDFEIVVTEAPTTSEPSSTLNPFPTSTFLPSAAATTQRSGRSSSSPSSSTSETSMNEEPAKRKVLFWPVVVVGAVVLLVLLLAAVLLIVYIKKSEHSVCLNRRRSSEHIRTEEVLYENCSPGSTCEDSTYQSLHPASREQDHTYSTLRHTP
ncbi:CMRF35-like molecule 9 isoform X1 [Parambassis ranga]|uniref:CMRF35-like molecule 9 isoform X1 n=1 Tax=Parambassis ranga TaxID=210632 RepID=A0A6P7IH76_9TELE|nr:CMRF35-like molecule 9 isoform X1 [Parambassis ranga]